MSACIAITACQGTGCTGYSEQKLTHSTEDEIRHKKWVDNLSERNQFCSAILHFRSAIKKSYSAKLHAHAHERKLQNCNATREAWVRD